MEPKSFLLGLATLRLSHPSDILDTISQIADLIHKWWLVILLDGTKTRPSMSMRLKGF